MGGRAVSWTAVAGAAPASVSTPVSRPRVARIGHQPRMQAGQAAGGHGGEEVVLGVQADVVGRQQPALQPRAPRAAREARAGAGQGEVLGDVAQVQQRDQHREHRQQPVQADEAPGVEVPGRQQGGQREHGLPQARRGGRRHGHPGGEQIALQVAQRVQAAEVLHQQPGDGRARLREAVARLAAARHPVRIERGARVTVVGLVVAPEAVDGHQEGQCGEEVAQRVVQRGAATVELAMRELVHEDEQGVLARADQQHRDRARPPRADVLGRGRGARDQQPFARHRGEQARRHGLPEACQPGAVEAVDLAGRGGRGGRGGARVHRASGSHSRGPSAHQRRTKPR